MRRWLALSAVAASVAACGGAHPCPDAGTTPGQVTFQGGDTITVRIADEPDERARGLMEVTHLPADEGMAFLFGEPTDATFWMKNTPVPLSIAFIRNRRVVAIHEMAPCSSEPCPTYASSEPYTVAIEANRGWFARHGIEVGDRVERFDGPFCD